ncbi:hypothetical protein RA8CHR_05580 [Variovorax sp. RA8]|nr:hypothetical protein RA8CHR_05580 [Variovorax sp. RA8]
MTRLTCFVWGLGGRRSFDFGRCCWCESGARNSPRRASHFLCLAKESNQRRATPLRESLRFATGNLRCSLQAGSAQTRFAQARAALFPPEAALLGTRRGEWIGPSLRSAANGLAARGLEQGHADALEGEHKHKHEHEHEHEHADVHVHVRECQRQRGPEAHAHLHSTQGRAMARWIPSPLWPRRGAELFADQGRACLSEASLRGPREKRAPQVARTFAAGRGQWGRLSLVTFFGEAKKVTRPPGRIPGSCLKPTATYEIPLLFCPRSNS